MDIVRFENSNILYLLILILPMIAYYFFKLKDGKATIQISTIAGVKKGYKTLKYYLRHIPIIIRIAAYTLLIIAMARPQSVSSSQTTTTEGIDIVMAIDVSGSMLARDFKPDRISAAKDIASQFILDRKGDRMGIVVFAGESYTQVPLTTDKPTLINLMSQIESGIIDDGTAIGNGLATTISRLKDSKAKSKVAILLTDGVNNSGQIAPATAAEIAKTYDIKLYTIGVGTRGVAPYPTNDGWGNIVFRDVEVEIDDKMLTEIAELTGGKYFRATDNEKLKSIYDEINQLEKSEVEVENFTKYHDQYFIFLLIGCLLLISELLIKYLYLRQIP